MTFEQLKAVREACLQNATTLVESAKTLLHTNAYHVCYHLAALALEEIGKISLVTSKYHREAFVSSDEPYDPDTEDHVKKLFWAIWGMAIAKGRVTTSEAEFSKGLAKTIHENRLKSLYVDPENLHPLNNILTQEKTEQLIGLVENRLGYEKCFHLEEPGNPMEEHIKWLLNASEDAERRPFVFSPESLSKFAELEGTTAWVQWLRKEEEKLKKEATTFLEKEVTRVPPILEGIGEPKWRIKVRIRSESHSIRNSFIKYWNQCQESIQLSKGNSNDVLICQFLLPSAISVKDVYDKGWWYAKIFVTALNIGAGGFFWWHVPKDTDTYFDEIIDVETKRKLKFERHEKLKVDWEPQALKEDKLLGIWRVIHYLARIKDTDEEAALDSYFTGLSLIGKTDIHLQFEVNAYERFYIALLQAMFVNKDWDGKEGLHSAIQRFFDNQQLTLNESDSENMRQQIALGESIVNREFSDLKVTLEDVINMKTLASMYFMLRTVKVIVFPSDTQDNKTT